MTIPELIPFNTTTTVCKECDNIKNPPELAFISTTCCGFISTVVQFNSPAIIVAGEKILNATRLTSGDLNDYKQPCILMVGSLPVANKPENFVYVIVLSSDSSGDCMQIAFSISKQLIYIRSFNSKSWSEWKTIDNIGA